MDSELSRLALGSAADGGVWARLRGLASALPQVGGVLAQADALRAQPIAELPPEVYLEYDRTGDRDNHGSRYFQRRRRLAALALSALLDPEEDTGELAATIAAICSEPVWALPAHMPGRGEVPRELHIDLFAAETGSALAEITALLKDRLPDAVVRSARDHVVRRVIEPYERYRFAWEELPNNWSAVCAASIAMAALQVCERERVVAMAPRLRAGLRRSLDGYGEDGVCVEGFGYWYYGFGYYLVATQALDAALGPDPVGEPARAAEAARWPSRAYLDGSTVVPFADTWVTDTVSQGLLALAARRYGDVARPAPETVRHELIDECGRWALALHGLCQLPAVVGDGPFADDPARPLWYPDAQWLVVPAGPRSPIGFAVRAGHNDEPHNHNDVGSFAVAAGGELLLGDAGRGVYDREYFGPTRYDNPAAGSHGHPVPMIDGVAQAVGADARAVVLSVDLDGGRERLVVDLTAAYPHPGLVRLVRTLERDGPNVSVSDAVEAAEPVRVTQRFVSTIAPEVLQPGLVRVTGRRAVAELRFDAGLEVATGAFPVGRGSFADQVHWVDLTAESLRDGAVATSIAVEVL